MAWGRINEHRKNLEGRFIVKSENAKESAKSFERKRTLYLLINLL